MKNIPHKLIVLVLLAIAAAAIPGLAADKKTAAPAAAEKKNELVTQGWTKRCMEPKTDDKSAKKVCAIYERLDMKEPALRISEIAIGYDPAKDKKDAAIAKIVMPLGLLLDNGIVMKVDEAKTINFKPSFCTNEGCVSVIALPKDVIDAMAHAKSLTFLFKSADGRDVKLDMGLAGFEKALKELE